MPVLGLDTSDYSFGYVARLEFRQDLKELQASLETIRAAANDLTTIDGTTLLELQQERQAQQEQTPPRNRPPSSQRPDSVFHAAPEQQQEMTDSVKGHAANPD